MVQPFSHFFGHNRSARRYDLMYRTDWLHSLQIFNLRQDRLKHFVAIKIASFKQCVCTHRGMKPSVLAVLRDQRISTGSVEFARVITRMIHIFEGQDRAPAHQTHTVA